MTVYRKKPAANEEGSDSTISCGALRELQQERNDCLKGVRR
jgi:hypothetical protein